MIQVYKKNNLFIIEDTCSETIYPNLTQEEAIVLLKNFNRRDPESRCSFAIDTDDIKFEYAFLDYKGKENAELKQQLEEKEKENDTLTAKLEQANEIINNPDTLIFQQQELIDNLQAQLAEKETEIEFLEGTINSMQEDISYWEQQLTEKEKEIEDLKAQRHIYLNRSVEECNKITDLEFELQHKYQEKISFAVEQLEKVKKFYIHNVKWTAHENMLMIEYIDNQINELKGKAEDVKD